MVPETQEESREEETFIQKTKGGFLRFLAIILDCSLAFALFSFFSNFEWLNSAYKEIHRISLSLNLFKNENFLHHTTPFLFLNLFFIVSIRFWTTLIFGVSYSQMLLGLRGSISFWWNRIGGGVRVLLELFLLPFIVFDLICLFRLRTLKEFLTYTHVVDRDPKIPLFRILFLLPLFAILMLTSPLYHNRSLLEDPNIKLGKRTKKVKLKSSINSLKKHYSSNIFKFSSFSSLSGGRFIILPSFDIFKEGSKRKIKPYFVIYDKESLSIGEWRLEKKIYLLTLFDRIKGIQPLFSKYYPNLSVLLDEERKDFSLKKYKGEYQAKFILNEKILEEIQRYSTISFELNLKNIYQHMVKNGPFFGGHILFKQSLLKFVPSWTEPRVDQIKLGNGIFLRLRQNFSNKSFLENEWRETLLSLNSHNSLIFSFKWSDGASPRKDIQSFYKDFFAPMIWYFDYKNLFAFPLKKENMKPFHIGDYYTKRSLSKKNILILENYIKNYFFNLAKEILFSKSNDKKFKVLLVKAVQRMVDIGEIVNEKAKNYYSASYLSSLKGLKVAILNGDKGHIQKGLK